MSALATERRFALALGLAAALVPGVAAAHGAARGFVLLLPTGWMILGGALTVLATFALMLLLPDRLFATQAALPASRRQGVVAGAISVAVLAAIVAIGFLGPSDPLENLLVLSVWTLFWVVIVITHPLAGNYWAAINPFAALAAPLAPSTPPLVLGERLSYWPAVALFAAFAWFQLVYPAPEDPRKLAMMVVAYSAVTVAAAVLFGPAAWWSRGDPFAVFLSQLAAAAPIGAGGRLQLPGKGLLALKPLPVAGIAFVLLTLSSITFDGLSHTFLWVASTGFNPLDFPGRTAMIGVNSAGLTLSFVALAAAYGVAIAAGWAWAGRPGRPLALAGRLVFSLIPISIAFHFAHYLADLLVNLQYLVKALNDPLENGADLLRLDAVEVTTSFLNTASGVQGMFITQTVAVVLGHAVAVAVAHAMVVDTGLDRRQALCLETPLALLMVLYTAIGLWLLASPAIA